MPGNTDASYAQARASGPPAAPLPFEEIALAPARRVMKPVHVPDDDDEDDSGDTTATGMAPADKIPDRPAMGLQRAESMSGNVLVVLDDDDGSSKSSKSSDVNQAQRAYWIQRKIGKTTHGSVRIGYVLRRRKVDEGQQAANGNGDDNYYNTDGGVQWEVTPCERRSSPSTSGGSGSGVSAAAPETAAYEMVAIKMYEKSKCTPGSNATAAVGPAVEIAASQLLARHSGDPAHHHVLSAVEVVADERFVYLIMPYCDGGDLLSVLESRGRLEESVARHVFKQLLSVSSYICTCISRSHQCMTLLNCFTLEISWNC